VVANAELFKPAALTPAINNIAANTVPNLNTGFVFVPNVQIITAEWYITAL